LPWPAGWALTMLFVLLGWVLFRAADFGIAASIIASLSGANGFGGGLSKISLLAAGAAVSLLLPSAHEIKDRLPEPAPAAAAGAALAAAFLAGFCVLEVGRGPPLNFIYFQF
jgi:alginate O-acetyltransferase complex protein AlgI